MITKKYSLGINNVKNFNKIQINEFDHKISLKLFNFDIISLYRK